MSDGARPLCVALRPLFLTMVALDSHINPFRPEIAAKYLKGQVEAERFVEGIHRQVVEPVTALRHARSHEASLDSEALLGERVIVYETTEEGWAWGQLETDGYVVGCRRTHSDRAGPGADPQGRGFARVRIPGAGHQAAPDHRATDGRTARHRTAG